MTTEALGSRIEMSDVDAAGDPLWAALVSDRRSDVFHSPDWARVLQDTYGFGVRARILHHGAQPLAGMLLVTVEDHLGTRHVSLPFSDFCDPLVDDAVQLRHLMADTLGDPHPVSMKCVFDRHAAEIPGLSDVARLAWHRVGVSDDVDTLWSGIDSTARRAIRKATAAGLTVRPAASIGDLRTFFELHLGVRKHKYRLLSQPWRFFESIWEHFLSRDRGVLLLAEVEGRTLGGVLYLEWKDTLYYKFNASDLGELPARPNDAVLWEGMRWAHDRGLSWVDLGVSDLDQPGLIKYKRKYATEEGEVTVWRKPGTHPTGTGVEARGLLTDLTALFVDESVPDAVTERAGDAMYRYFV